MQDLETDKLARLIADGKTGDDMQVQIPQKLLVNVEEAAHMLDISPKTLYNRCHPKSKNPFPVRPKRVGRSLRFAVKDLEKYVDQL